MKIKARENSVTDDLADLQPGLWVSRYADYLYAFALTRIHCEEKAKDLVQDTFLAALEAATSYEKRSSEKTWLTAILKNKILDLYRKQCRSVSDRQEIIDHFFRRADGHWLPSQSPADFELSHSHPIEEKEFHRILQACIKKLPQAWLAVFTMKLLEDYSTAVICRQLKITQANFWVIMHRAKLNIRACLEKYS